MSASIRGHQGTIKLFQDGAVVGIVDITSVDIKQDSSFSRTFYVGRAVPEGDQTIEGWSGSLEMQVKNAEVDKFIDALVTANLNGIGVSDYTMVTTENYADGTSQSYVYYDCQFKMSRKQSGLNEKMTKTLEFQCSGRQAL
jgi:hypothetical protein